MSFKFLSILKASFLKTIEIEDIAQNLEAYLLMNPNYHTSVTAINADVGLCS